MKTWLKQRIILFGMVVLISILTSCSIKSDRNKSTETMPDQKVEESMVTDISQNKMENNTENILVSAEENIEPLIQGNNDKDTEASNSKVEESKDFVSNGTNEYENVKHLLPNSEYWVKETNAYICRYMNEDLYKDYHSSLIDQGYELFLEENVGGYPYYYFANKNIRIQVIHANTLAIISINHNYEDMVTEEKALSNEEALKLIQTPFSYYGEPNNDSTQESEDANSSADYPADIIVKYWIKDLYKKTSILAYTAYSSEGKVVGTYLIHENKAFEILDNLENTCIADLDQNGTYELISLFGYGFGLYRIHLNVYQLENPEYLSSLTKLLFLTYYNCFVPMSGYGELKLHKVNDSEVHLVEGKDGKDYGPLVIIGEDGFIVPEHIEEFPYYQWDKAYNFSKNTEKNNSDKTMKEIPKLEVSVSDTSIPTKSRKVDWNGESEEKIEFKELMKDTVPRFECPPSLLEFKDEICLFFKDAIPTSISVEDYLLTEDGDMLYNEKTKMVHDVRIGEAGNYYFGLQNHVALMLSSSTATYTNPSYRGFLVQCEFGEEQTCEYIFVLSVEPMWVESE